MWAYRNRLLRILSYLTFMAGALLTRHSQADGTAQPVPAKIRVASARTMELDGAKNWSSMPRYLGGSTLFLPIRDSTSDLHFIVDEPGVVAMLCPVPPERVAPAAARELTTLAEIGQQGWRRIATVHLIDRSRDPPLRPFALYWKEVAAKEQYKLRTHPALPAVAVLPRSEMVSTLVSRAGVNSSADEGAPTRVQPVVLPPWEYDPIDLLDRAATPSLSCLLGTWTFRESALLGATLGYDQSKAALIAIDVTPPAEYDIDMEVTRLSGKGALKLGLVSGDSQFVLAMGGAGHGSGLEELDGKTPNATFTKGELFTQNKKSWVHINVRVTRITVTVDGRQVVDWTGDVRRLGSAMWWARHKVHRQPFLWFEDAAFRFDRAVLFPQRSGPASRSWQRQKTVTYRKWTFTDGGGAADLRFNGLDSRQLLLESRQGDVTKFAADKLCGFDQAYVRRTYSQVQSPKENLADEALGGITDALVYIQLHKTESYQRGIAGVLYKKKGNTGYVVTAALPFSAWSGSKEVHYGDTQVTFHYGKSNQQRVPAELLFIGPGRYGPYQDIAILKLHAENLPEPIDISDSRTPNGGDPLFLVTYPDMRDGNEELPQEQREVIVVKSNAIALTQSFVEKMGGFEFDHRGFTAAGGPIVDGDGRLLGIANYRQGSARTARWLAIAARGQIEQVQFGVVAQEGNTAKVHLVAHWSGNPDMPHRIAALVAPHPPELPKRDHAEMNWSPLSGAQLFKLDTRGDYVGGVVSADRRTNQAFQFQVTLRDGETFYTQPQSLSLPAAAAQDAWLAATPDRVPDVPAPQAADRPTPKPTGSSFSLVGQQRDMEFGKVTTLKMLPEKRPQHLAWSRDSKQLYMLEKRGQLRMVSLDDLTVRRELQIPSEECRSIATTSQGMAVVVADMQQLWVVDEETLEVKRRIQLPNVVMVAGLADSAICFASGSQNELYSVDVENGRLLRLFRPATFRQDWFTQMQQPNAFPPAEFGGITLSPNGKYLFTRDAERLYRFKVQGHELFYEDASGIINRNPGRPVVSNDSRWVVIPNGGGNLQLTAMPIKPYSLYVFPVDQLDNPKTALHIGSYPSHLGFNETGDRIFTSNFENTLLIFNGDGKKLGEYKLADRGSLEGLLAHPQGSRVLLLTSKQPLWVELKD